MLVPPPAGALGGDLQRLYGANRHPTYETARLKGPSSPRQGESAEAANHSSRRRRERLAQVSPTAAQHLLRTDGFPHVSFHGGIGGPQTQPFILAPSNLPLPDGPIIGAASVHELLTVWRRLLNGGDTREAAETEPVAVS